MNIVEIKPTAWIQTYKGHRFNPWDVDPATIDIEDIAHALANTARWGGHSRKFYSVAQHSVCMARAVDVGYAMAALLHDASEAYIGDMPAPIKATLPDYKDMEKNVMQAIANKFGFTYPLNSHVKEWDKWWTTVEAFNLLPDIDLVADWASYNPAPELRLDCWDPDYAEQEFLNQFNIIRSVYEPRSSQTIAH